MQFGYMQSKAPFDRAELRLELLRRVNELAGVELSVEEATKYPSFSLTVVREAAQMQVLLNALDLAFAEIKKT